MLYSIQAKLAKNPLYDKTKPSTGDPLHAGMIRTGPTDKRGLAMNPDHLSLKINASNQLAAVPPDYPPCGPALLQHQTNDANGDNSGLTYPTDAGMSSFITISVNAGGVLKIHGFLWAVIYAADEFRVDATSPTRGRFVFYLVPSGSVNYSTGTEADCLTAGGIRLAHGIISSAPSECPGHAGEVWFPEPIDLSAMAAGAPRAGNLDVFHGCALRPTDVQGTVYFEGLQA